VDVVSSVAVVLARFGSRFTHPGHRPLRLLVLVLFIALVVAVVWLVVREVRRRRAQPALAGPSATFRTPTPPGYDDALEQLRLRYVRGEIERDEYLRKVEDLGGTPPTV
jgi:putative membrane protein